MIEPKSMQRTPGMVALFGSGETSPSGQKIFDAVLSQLSMPPRVALLETPAGFELNSDTVIGKVEDFLHHHLQNYNPITTTIPARQRDTQFSPDDPHIVEPIFTSDLIFMGPGSPTYAVRQLRDSLAWQALLARHRRGAAVALASAAAIAISAYALPVYEIFKVGEDLHWKPGLDLFGIYGLRLVFIPHWNNAEGGEDLDTSRCFMGKSRFARLVELLPPDLTLVGIDEQTGLLINPQTGNCQVIGSGQVTLIHTGKTHQDASSIEELAGTGLEEVANIRRGHVHRFRRDESFSLGRIGDFRPPEAGEGLPSQVWAHALSVEEISAEKPEPSAEVLRLVEERQTARQNKDWVAADELRARISELGWVVQDTLDGPQLNQ